MITFLLLIQSWSFQAFANSNETTNDDHSDFIIAVTFNAETDTSDLIHDNDEDNKDVKIEQVENFSFVEVLAEYEDDSKVKILKDDEESSEKNEFTGLIENKNLISENIEEFLVDQQEFESIEEVEKILATLSKVAEEETNVVLEKDSDELIEDDHSINNSDPETISEEDSARTDIIAEDDETTMDAIEVEGQNDSESKTTEDDSQNIIDSEESNFEEATNSSDEVAVQSQLFVASSVSDLYGVALKDSTHVYGSKSQDSDILRSYNQGHILKYQEHETNWYIATVIINGQAKTGYIHVDDVDTTENNPQRLTGFALKASTPVYTSPSKNSKVIRSYNRGHNLVYSTFSTEWYKATVYVDGVAQTGYIHTNDVGNDFETSGTRLKGVALKNPTPVYSNTSKNSNQLRTYNQGHILSYRTHNSDWFEATVYLNGSANIGYIHADDVETADQSPSELEGIGLKNGTNVYNSTSTNSSVLRSYNQGHVLKYRTFTSNWYEATVYINGERNTGYISASDVDEIVESTERLEGIGVNAPTYVYSKPSINSTSLRSYSEGRNLVYQPYTSEWYKASVSINGSWEVGYIHSSHVRGPNTEQERLEGLAINSSTNVYTGTSKNSDVLRSYSLGHNLIFRSYTTNWYEATVYLNGKQNTGYIHKDDIFINSGNEHEVSEIKQGIISVASNLNVRSGPGTSHSKIGELANASLVSIISQESNGWYIILYNGGIGYVSGSYVDDVTEIGEDFITDQIIGYVNSTTLNVRSGPGTSHNQIDSLSKDTRVEITSTHGVGSNNSWHRIKYNNNKIGYVSAGYIQLASKPASNSGPLKGKTIILDPGHGAHDPGGIGGNMREKDVVLDISLRAEELLRAAGAEVIMIRRTDMFLSLSQRSFLANRADADVFVSVHTNIFNGDANGTETFWHGRYQRANSIKLANALQSATVSKMGTRHRRVAEGNYAVIRNTEIPSALLEVAFMDHAGDAAKLRSNTYRDRAAEGIRDGLINYFR